MPKRRTLCDVPGCGCTRQRWQRLCDTCFRALPGDIRVGLIEAKRARRDADWREYRRRAADHLRIEAERRQDHARQAFDRTRRMMGEHE